MVSLLPPIFGWLAGTFSAGLYPAYLAVFAVLMVAMTELLNRKLAGGTR